MAALTNHLESGLLNHLLRGVAYIPSSILYIGLIRNFNIENIESGIIDEPSVGSYSRQSYISNTNNWATPYGSGTAFATHNNIAIEFPIATANIGEVSGVFVSDSSSSGNILFYSSLSNSRNIRQNDQFIMPSGALKITFN